MPSDEMVEHSAHMMKVINPERGTPPDLFAMPGLSHIVKIREYCDYLEQHLINVQLAWRTLEVVCQDMRFIYDDFYWATIRGMVMAHDLSKFSPEEFIAYQRKFFPAHLHVSDAPARTDKIEFANAWEHHKENNLHHWQSWPDATVSFPGEHECHCVCMVADWMAMGMHFGDTAQEYYEGHKDEIELPEWAVTFMYEIFERLERFKEKESDADDSYTIR